MKKVKFNIQGMTCSSCSSHVEKAVKKLNGIKKVNVNLVLNNMVVEYDENVLNNNDIIKSVIDSGYGASVANKEENRKETKIVDNKDVIKSMKKRLIISICFLIPLMYIAMYHKFIKNTFHGTENAINFAFSQFLLLIPIVYVNRQYFIVGFKRLLKRTPNMDSLIAIGATAAILYGVYAIYMISYGLGHNQIDLVNNYSMDIYFESAGTILTLITVGKFLESKSKGKTADAISKLINLVPKTVTVIRNGKEQIVNLEEVAIDDIILIKPGENIGVDGIIIEGESYIDQSSITGESIPVEKGIGDNVISGTINKNGSLKIKALKVGEDTTLAQIIRLVEEASNSKAPISRLADKVSGIFVPCVILIAIIATIFWILNGQSFEFALSIGIAVLVISCPCALGLATPVAIMVGTGKGAENGILIKSAESLEMLHLVDTVILDKTGTITEGRPKVTDIISKVEEERLLKIAGSLENKSEHPLAEAITQKVIQENIEILNTEDFKAVSGRGVMGKINGKVYFGGNINFMMENNISTIEAEKQSSKLLQEGKTVIYFADENEIIGIIAVADTIKDTSYEAIEILKKEKIEVVMLTGDNKIVANTIGKKLKINNIISEVLPQDKEKQVSKLQEEGKRVAFVGDGINDSPALVKANVGLAIGSGTDIAIESADIVLMKNNLLDVVYAMNLSRAVMKNIKMNLFWAFFYNIIGIPIAAGIFYLGFGFKLSPMIGAVAMSLSSVCVVTNALRLRKFKCKFNCEGVINKKETNMTKEIIIEGMQCNHCKMTVERVLGELEEVEKVKVNLEKKNAIIQLHKNIESDKIKQVIENEGFSVMEIK